MAQQTKVISCGVGALGSEMVRLMLEKPNLKIVAATDVSEKAIGQDLGRVAGLGHDLGMKVLGNPTEVLRTTEADVVLYAAEARFPQIFQTIRVALESRKNVISSGDEACFPWTKSPDLAKKADELAKENGVTFLGTGINPGFMMDFLPIALTGIMKRVDKIIIRRVADTSTCGLNYWQQCGYGRSKDEFNELLAKGVVGGGIHFREDMEMTARALGWGKIEYKEEKKPLVSKAKRKALSGVVEPGTVSGVEQSAHGFSEGKEVLTYYYDIIIHPEEDGLETGQVITIEGEPGVVCSVTGEQAKQSWSTTAAIMVNSIPRVLASPPGVLAVYELPPARFVR